MSIMSISLVKTKEKVNRNSKGLPGLTAPSAFSRILSTSWSTGRRSAEVVSLRLFRCVRISISNQLRHGPEFIGRQFLRCHRKLSGSAVQIPAGQFFLFPPDTGDKVPERSIHVVTELYVYPSSGTEKGENLAGDGLESGESVEVTVTGYMLRTENETLYTIEYVVGNKLYGHRSLHVEDLLFETPINLVGIDGVTSATFVSFGNSNLA